MRTSRLKMSGMFEEMFNFIYHPLHKLSPGTGALNMIENDDHMLLDVSVPGFNKNELKVNLDKNKHLLLIQGTKEIKTEDKNVNYHYKEFSSSTFMRQIPVDDSVEIYDTELKDGILSLKISKPKVEHQREEMLKIEIQ